jgi:hypothetical protein
MFSTGLPGLTISQVGPVPITAPTTGSYATPDITLPLSTVSPVAVVVTATGIQNTTQVTVWGKPLTGMASSAVATLNGGTATASLSLDLTQTTVISAEATFVVAALDVPVRVAQAAGPDDPVTHARVAAAFGGGSHVVYLTRAGRELPLP